LSEPVSGRLVASAVTARAGPRAARSPPDRRRSRVGAREASSASCRRTSRAALITNSDTPRNERERSTPKPAPPHVGHASLCPTYRSGRSCDHRLLELPEEVPNLTVGDKDRRTLRASRRVSLALDLFGDREELEVPPGVLGSPLFHALQGEIPARKRLEFQVHPRGCTRDVNRHRLPTLRCARVRRPDSVFERPAVRRSTYCGSCWLRGIPRRFVRRVAFPRPPWIGWDTNMWSVPL
jgi:hypothetical protein